MPKLKFHKKLEFMTFMLGYPYKKCMNFHVILLSIILWMFFLCWTSSTEDPMWSYIFKWILREWFSMMKDTFFFWTHIYVVLKRNACTISMPLLQLIRQIGFFFVDLQHLNKISWLHFAFDSIDRCNLFKTLWNCLIEFFLEELWLFLFCLTPSWIRFLCENYLH